MNEDILMIALVFGGGALFLFSISPIGRALAHRIKEGRPVVDPGAQAAMLTELEQVRRDMAELAERVDFMERLQARAREGERLGPPR
ncbi:MAG TPA: hypothetical protein VH158_02855 [Gemmatimonadales bacterium]|jgi:hypothetical protein|nr:hypothetical protein [Gemmatimonadales bacterium]